MVRRTVSTIAGPRTYELISARLGELNITSSPSGRFQVSATAIPGSPFRLLVDLRLMFDGAEQPYKLVFPTSQEYDILVRDAAGKQLYRWSDGKAFTQVVHERLVSRELRIGEEIIPVPGSTPPPGTYMLEAWLATGPGQREFFAAAPFEIRNTK